MKNITILDQSFFDSKKINLAKKKFLAIQLFIFPKKFLTQVFDPFPIKLFFSGATQKDKKIHCTKLVMFSILVNDCSFKKITASKNQKCKT